MKTSMTDQEKAPEQVHRVRITVSSKNVKNLEKVCAELLNTANNKKQKVEVEEEPPAKVLPITSGGYGTYNSQGRHRRAAKKGGAANFRWSPSMTRFLLPFLVEQAKLGQKVNRTFRREAFMAAANAVNEKFKVKCTDSNVENHMRTIKSRYHQIKKLQGMGNTEWDDNEKIIIMDPAAYGAHIMANPRDEPFLNKNIEMYDEMVILCSEDHQTSVVANGAMENNNAEEELLLVQATSAGDVNIEMDDDDVGMEEEAQSRSPQVSTSSESEGRAGPDDDKKPNLGDKIDHLALRIGELAEAIRSRHRGISSELFLEVMKCDGYDEASLGKAFDYLHEHERLARAFLAKNYSLRLAWLSEFFCEDGRLS